MSHLYENAYEEEYKRLNAIRNKKLHDLDAQRAKLLADPRIGTLDIAFANAQTTERKHEIIEEITAITSQNNKCITSINDSIHELTNDPTFREVELRYDAAASAFIRADEDEKHRRRQEEDEEAEEQTHYLSD
jgi:hypothetical protein